MVSTAVMQIVASDCSDDDMLKAHSVGGLRDPSRFVVFEGKRLRRGDSAEVAGPRATVAGNHESRSAAAPTFPVIWAAGAFAYSMQVQFIEQRSRMREAR